MRRLFILLLMGLTFTFAQTDVTVDLQKLSPSARKIVVNSLQNGGAGSESGDFTNPDNVSAWIKVGEQIGEGIYTLVHKLGVDVKDFLDTSLGKWSLFILVWKVILGRLFFGVFGLAVVLTSFYKLHGVYKYKLEDGGFDVRSRYDWHSREAKTVSAVMHVIMFLVLIILLMVG